MTSYKLWICGKWLESESRRDVISPFDNKVVAVSHLCNPSQLEEAIEASRRAFSHFKKSSRFIRSRLLLRMSQEIETNRNRFVEKMILEAGKPRVLAEVEVNRAIATFTIAHEEAKRLSGDIVPIDTDLSSREFNPAISMWVPRGPTLAITPFNFPLNLVAHKVAPALAVGASIILKPAPQAPGCAFLLAEIFESIVNEISVQEEISKDVFQVLNATNEVTEIAVKDPRLSTLSFTGSDKVGWHLQSLAVRKKVLLELGGNAGVLIHSDAYLKRAASRCAAGGFGYAGQTCISVQRIFAHESIYEEFTKLLLEETDRQKFGDPADKNVTVGPLIDSTTASRVTQWIDDAKKQGAKELTTSKRIGNVLSPVILVNVPVNCKVSCEEVFGPVVVVNKYSNFKEALDGLNNSRFGLQAGVFTDSNTLIQQSFETLEVGGVLINEIPTFRADQMPYGGVKDSGLGREGLRYAMEDYCERRSLIVWKGQSK